MNLLHLDASARPRSISRELGRAFVTAWRHRLPDSGYVHRDLAAEPVPPITAAWTEICDNLMRDEITALDRLTEGARTDDQRAAWSVIEPLLTELITADVVLITTPMYNYGAPAALKAWIDQVTFPRMDLAPRRFVVLAARGGSYAPGAPNAGVEHLLTYLTDFVTGHFRLPAPRTLAVDLANARVDPLLESRRQEYQASLRQARHGIDALVADLLTERRAA
ncbi:FMN-dependent NADH-azoreductase [Microlunatus speluncae]|uniref:FMN-dependent NADH-azoreductase n=1 Tax=Microlunatus speluncae TaxID=2594267 RepID=UPI0012664A62|nr:NAD(P)H-dependent oxidoreductase [Microlunatus speluncae]